ncbi:ABC transporter substrate-binding protein [Bradyrhizobium sp.]|uniref:ABC transporter substrate-binding protein n=1 Tax=Bradyrhizobium sp. TaxID=376 RepID=UPI0039E6A706
MKAIVLSTVIALTAAPAMAQEAFNWRKHDGQTINLMLNNTAWTQTLRPLLDEFTKKTGIKLRTEVFSEEQYRARLNTLLQAKSTDVDAFMTLPSREAPLFQKNGWYADLRPLLKSSTSPDYDYDGISKSLREGGIVDGAVTSIPINVEGPLFYWRRDIFEKCKIDKPEFLEDLPAVAAKIKACDSSIYPWAARGLRGTVGYPLGGFIYNMGGDFKTPDGKATLCLPGTIKGLQIYGDLLKDYGPPGATNHTYIQVIDLLAQGRVAMTNESSGDMINVLKRPERIEDISIGVLPKGKETGISKPIVINWGVSVSNYSQKKDAAWYFLQWVTSKEVQALMAEGGIAPPRASVFESEKFAKWIDENRPRREWAKAVKEISATGSPDYQTPTLTRTPEARDILSNVVQQIVLGQADAKTAACAVTEQVQALQQ